MSDSKASDNLPAPTPELLREYEQRYGRDLTSVEAAVIHAWNMWGDKLRWIISFPDIPREQLDNALRSFGACASGGLVLGLLDATIRNTGKEGVLLSTDGIYWRLPGTSKPQSCRYDYLDPHDVAFKRSFAQSTIILSEKIRLSISGHEDECRLVGFISFLRRAILAMPSNLPETGWEFCSSEVDGKAKSACRFMFADEVKAAFLSHVIQTNWLYRKYNPRLAMRHGIGGAYSPISDDLFQDLGLSKADIVNAERNWNRRVIVIATTLAVLVLVGMVVGLQKLMGSRPGPQSPAAWGRFLGGLAGVVAGSVAMFRVHRVLGILTLIAGLIYVLRSCMGS